MILPSFLVRPELLAEHEKSSSNPYEGWLSNLEAFYLIWVPNLDPYLASKSDEKMLRVLISMVLVPNSA